MKTMTTTAIALLAGTAMLAATAARAQEPLKIGVPTALTGTYADLGNQAKRAIEFAVKQANDAGGVAGHKVEVEFLDTEAKPDLARRQAEKLALQGNKVLIGAIASGEALAIAPLLARWDALYVATINKSDKITGDSCTARMFRVNNADSSDAATATPWLKGRPETEWALIAADIAWGRDVAASFGKSAAEQGKKVVSENFSPLGTNDFATYIQKIKNSDAKGIYVALAGRDAVNFATQAKQYGLFDDKIVAGVSFVTDNTVQAIGDSAKGISGIINYSSTLDTPENKAFVAAWEKTYPGTVPSNFEGDTYIGMQVILQAVQATGSVKASDLAKAIPGRTYDTIVGKVLLRKEDNQLVRPNYFGVVEINDGKLRPVIKMSVPADIATTPPSAACKLG
ncbi:ABC transporter substrate-binding protein [Bradyrhizobium sp. U87765 SZCCT0131]|uniref:ABC transporter substrate-binding protein n=1 Tax=unclassified Bradyrhizobium TaxID=2631580 RepID=UPI001BA9AF89|nr:MULTISPECIES: ABC transporter substrate-binding protein [unclassified Bradyrhizobium]MBR1219785.1 ABC transporter substrate-binding protein [Bradyrhizobium sp. U87765 SZCCT0131]MBR1262436.1 ABC transporter substrate-binding protein [Bradyrhizobium sp. U87765 SZCCT0134]MBR1308381.1 ABC transporter substrate-binding protein [Bradyrhizobium sp. U87765 SZCCT0110]MBR1318218.1 ABC transporter substrate-binding protein [Bradyrhizobium sp. U87765 SZCCT0109]MBR1351921.1 ABC transporter substrate-bin